uniref:Uncharacterized protein n=1 Tax=Zea mays TaxID=4577 RepID=B6UEK4_MAIZE|nr:hypothetical protein [Zea mays]
MAAFAALFDPLYCPEEHLDLYRDEPGEGADEQWPGQHGQQEPAVLDDELPALFEAHRAKEGVVLAEDGGYGGAAGREAAVGWVSRAVPETVPMARPPFGGGGEWRTRSIIGSRR